MECHLLVLYINEIVPGFTGIFLRHLFKKFCENTKNISITGTVHCKFVHNFKAFVQIISVKIYKIMVLLALFYCHFVVVYYLKGMAK